MSARLADLRELVVDGVRVFHLPGPTKTHATLHFGAGLQDETWDTVGLTHLVEHLAMTELPSSVLEPRSGVGVAQTLFDGHGRPEEVGAFLQAVCRNLADLPLQHLEREKAALAAEGTVGADPTAAKAWALRHGLAGPGLATTDGHGPLVLTADEVLAHAARHFTAGRAALAVLGPLPEGLSLPLRSDTPAPRRLSRVRHGVLPGDGPEWVEAGSPDVGLLLDGFAVGDEAARVATTTLTERLRDVVRGERGLTYTVAMTPLHGPDGDTYTLTLDVRSGTADVVAGLVWEQLCDLAANGPTQAELDHVLAGYAAAADASDDDVVEEEPFRLASDASLDAAAGGQHVRSLAAWAADTARTTRDDVRERLALAARRALLVLPEGARLPESAQRAAPITERPWCAVAPELPPGREFRPPSLRRLFSRHARVNLVLSDETLAWQGQDGVVHVVRWDDVVGVTEIVPLPQVDGVVVVGRERCGIPVYPQGVGRDAYEEVVRRLEPQVERLRQAKRAWERSAQSTVPGA